MVDTFPRRRDVDPEIDAGTPAPSIRLIRVKQVNSFQLSTERHSALFTFIASWGPTSQEALASRGLEDASLALMLESDSILT